MKDPEYYTQNRKKILEKMKKMELELKQLEEKKRKNDHALAVVERQKRTRKLIIIGALFAKKFNLDLKDFEQEEIKEFLNLMPYVTMPFPEKIENGKRTLSWYETSKAWAVYQKYRAEKEN